MKWCRSPLTLHDPTPHGAPGPPPIRLLPPAVALRDLDVQPISPLRLKSGAPGVRFDRIQPVQAHQPLPHAGGRPANRQATACPQVDAVMPRCVRGTTDVQIRRCWMSAGGAAEISTGD
jgi:hypothetical protein